MRGIVTEAGEGSAAALAGLLAAEAAGAAARAELSRQTRLRPGVPVVYRHVLSTRL